MYQPTSLPDCIPVTSRDIIASLNEHLLQTLRTEREKEEELEAMQDALEKYRRKFSVLIHQQVCSELLANVLPIMLCRIEWY